MSQPLESKQLWTTSALASVLQLASVQFYFRYVIYVLEAGRGAKNYLI